MSVETPWRFRSIQVGAEIWYSTICASPRWLSALTLTVEAPTWTSMRSRLECVACTRTEFWFQALTTISPPKLSTSSRIPGRTGTVVSVCWATASVMTARSEEHTSEFQSHSDLVCRLLLEKKKTRRHSQPPEFLSRIFPGDDRGMTSGEHRSALSGLIRAAADRLSAATESSHRAMTGGTGH